MESKSKSKFLGTSISYVRFRQKLPLKNYQILNAKGRDDVGKVDTLRKSPFFLETWTLGSLSPLGTKLQQ